MKSKMILTIVLGLLLVTSGAARADLSLSVDGTLSDWGVVPGSNYTPLAGVNSWVEPEIGNQGYVGPGYGGQTFNVEALYSAVSDGKFYFAIITGLPPTGAVGWNGQANERFYPGDILIDFWPYYEPTNNPVTPNGTFDFAIETTTYGTGYEHGGTEGAGALFSGVTPGLARIQWDGVYYPYEIQRDADHEALGTFVNTSTEFIYTLWGGDHYVIEGCVPVDVLFGPGTVGGLNCALSWTMGCANDVGTVFQTVESEEHEIVPEPTSLLLLVGSVAFGLMRRRSA